MDRFIRWGALQEWDRGARLDRVDGYFYSILIGCDNWDRLEKLAQPDGLSGFDRWWRLDRYKRVIRFYTIPRLERLDRLAWRDGLDRWERLDRWDIGDRW